MRTSSYCRPIVKACPVRCSRAAPWRAPSSRPMFRVADVVVHERNGLIVARADAVRLQTPCGDFARNSRLSPGTVRQRAQKLKHDSTNKRLLIILSPRIRACYRKMQRIPQKLLLIEFNEVNFDFVAGTSRAANCRRWRLSCRNRSHRNFVRNRIRTPRTLDPVGHGAHRQNLCGARCLPTWRHH